MTSSLPSFTFILGLSLPRIRVIYRKCAGFGVSLFCICLDILPTLHNNSHMTVTLLELI